MDDKQYKDIQERAKAIESEISDAIKFAHSLKHYKDQDTVIRQIENVLRNLYLLYEFEDEYEKKD